MSGICGIVRFDSQAVKKVEIQNMLDAMQNRGNDTEGIWLDGNVGFGHKMLCTTTESLHENQPLVSENGDLVIVSDARIDNREELFEKLEINRDNFQIVTDTDLIILSYKKWGNDSPKYLIGDYAYVIWDELKKELLCVRDALGIKPFYYFFSEKYLVFSSEIQPFFILEEIKKEFNHESIRDLLLHRTLAHEKTLFNNIMRLPPMQNMTLLDQKLSFTRYWFPEQINENKELTFDEAKEKFNSLFRESVDACLRSAYPIGCELSGGLDSSSVFGVAVDMVGADNISSFSYRYGDLTCDEGQYIDAVINKFGTQKKVSIRVDQLDFKTQYTLERFHRERKDWPGMAVFLSHYSIIEEAQKRGIRIILTGQGGDHIVTGNMNMLSLYWERKEFKYLWQSLKVEKFSWDLIKGYLLSPLLPDWIRILLGKKPKNSQKGSAISPLAMYDDIEAIRTQISNYQWYEIGLLAGMHHSHWVDNNPYHLGGRYDIEFRHPFFNRRLVEFTLSLPPYMKLQNGKIKSILRAAMVNILPKTVSNRIDKAEFSPELELHQEDTKSFEGENSPLIRLFIMSEDEVQRARNLSVWQVQLVENWLDKHETS